MITRHPDEFTSLRNIIIRADGRARRMQFETSHDDFRGGCTFLAYDPETKMIIREYARAEELMRDPRGAMQPFIDAVARYLRTLDGPGWDANGSPVE